MTELTQGYVTVADDLINFDTKAFHLLGTASRLGIPGVDAGFSARASHFDMDPLVARYGQPVLDLLEVLNRDGGHRVEEVGVDQAAMDALTRFCGLLEAEGT